MSMMKEGTPFSIKHLQGKQPEELTEEEKEFMKQKAAKKQEESKPMSEYRHQEIS